MNGTEVDVVVVRAGLCGLDEVARDGYDGFVPDRSHDGARTG